MSIDEILNSLGRAITVELTAANDRASAAEAEMSRLVNGVRALVEPQPTTILAKALAIEPTRRPASVPDEAFLAELSGKWIGAGELRKRLTSNGHNIAEGTVYNRMRKLTSTRSDIESAAHPERWRLKANRRTGAPSGSNSRPKRGRRTRAQPPTEVKDRASAEVHMPILHCGDCLEVMATIPDSSVDLILVDLPYGVTRHKCDVRLPLDRLWAHYRRILKPTGAVVLFASQPFTTDLISSNADWFKYALVWEKNVTTGFLHASNKPLKCHEDVLIFSPGTTIHASRSERRMTYNPQGAVDAGIKKVKRRHAIGYINGAHHQEGREYRATRNCPRSVLRFSKDPAHAHPFQKPLAFLEYLIRTYSNEGELVLDNTMGSGSTCVAAMRTGRRSIGIEVNKEYFDVAEARVATELGKQQPQCVQPAVPTHRTKRTTIYNGDCLEVMRTLPPSSVDLVVTSPPYNLGVSSGGGIKSRSGRWKNAALANGYASYDDARNPAEYIKWQREVLLECWRLLTPTGAIFYQHKPRIQRGLLQTPLDLNPDLPVRQIVIWNRNCGFNFNKAFYLPSHEWIVIFAKPNFRLNEDSFKFRDVWDIPHERKNLHPAPFPVELPLRAIASTCARTILDPFMGSGTTGVAAVRCGRKFVGIELDGDYAALAHNRIEDEMLAQSRIEDSNDNDLALPKAA